MKTVVEVGDGGEVLSSIEVQEGEEISIKRKKSAWEEVVKVYGWNNPTILRTEELYKVVKAKGEVFTDIIAFAKAYGAEDERARKEGRDSEKATGV